MDSSILYFHLLASYLTLSLCLASMLLAALCLNTKKQQWLKLANQLGLAETIAIGLAGATGLVLVVLQSNYLQKWWIWQGIVIVAIYSVLMKRVTKQARNTEGREKEWLILQATHLCLLASAFATMSAPS